MNMLITAFEGQLATTPDYYEASDGTPRCTAVVLINRRIKNRSGSWVQAEATRRHIKAWRANATRLSQLPLGTTVVVIGTIETEAWTDSVSQERRTREYVIVDSIGQGLMLPRMRTGEHITLDFRRLRSDEF